jgi:hypothetical protein
MASGEGAVVDVDGREAGVFGCAVFTVFVRTEGDCASSCGMGLEGGVLLKESSYLVFTKAGEDVKAHSPLTPT